MFSNKRLWHKAAVVTAVAALAATSACSKQENEGGSDGKPAAGFPESPAVEIKEGKKGGTFRLAITEPTAIDPYNSQESEGILVTSHLFTGLAYTNQDGETEPAVAEEWESNPDCSEWTFTLKEGTKFHNGEEVTAESFKRGWERTTAKASASDVAYHFDQIEGFEEIQAGKAKELSGVEAVDPTTLKVKLTTPSCEFYLRTAHTAFSPVPKDAGDADNKEYNEAPIGNGPFQMDGKWEHEKSIKLKRFDEYTAQDPAYLDSVEITILKGADDAQQLEYEGFQDGTFDWARLPPEQVPNARKEFEPKGSFLSKKTFGINYLLPMVTKKPLDSVDARKAISMAIDRNAIIKGIFKNAQAPATSIVPGGFKEAYQPGVCGEACEFNPEKAKELAKKAGLKPGTELKMQLNAGAGHDKWMKSIKSQLEKNLGLKIDLTEVEFDEMLENQQQPDSTGLYRAAWGADYATPGNFLQPLLGTTAIGTDDPTKPATGDNRGRYSNPKVDELLNKATATLDEAERNKLYQQAEKIAIGDDLALIPVYERQQFRLAQSEKFINLRMDFHEDPDFRVISIK